VFNVKYQGVKFNDELFNDDEYNVGLVSLVFNDEHNGSLASLVSTVMFAVMSLVFKDTAKGGRK
jgi:hypothetical protein